MNNSELLKIAINAMKNSHAPLTKYNVGAALLSNSNTVYIGTNIEEYSIPGLSNCAERVAIQNAIAHGEKNFSKIAIVGGKCGKLDVISPCGVCLQYILDMCENIEIVTLDGEEIIVKKVTDYLNVPYELKNK